jgi:DNA-binding ferritin-like protein (Dps family)
LARSKSELDRKIRLAQNLLDAWVRLWNLAQISFSDRKITRKDEQEYQAVYRFISQNISGVANELSSSSRMGYILPGLGIRLRDYQPIPHALSVSPTLSGFRAANSYELDDFDRNWKAGHLQLNLLLGFLRNLKDALKLVRQRDAEVIFELKRLLRSRNSKFVEMYDGAYDALRSKSADKLRQSIASMRELLRQIINELGKGESRKAKVKSILGSDVEAELVNSLADVADKLYALQSREEHTEPRYDNALYAIKTCEYTLHYILKRAEK